MPSWKKVITSGSDALLNNVNIGDPEDGTYTDGLYTDFTEETNVGVVVDRFNEVLKGLSPTQAPSLDNLESSTSGTNSLKLAFGTSQTTASYINVEGTGSLPAVDFTETFSRSTGAGGGRLRLGTFATKTNITLVLNQDVAEDSGAFVNYSANSFNVPVDGGETYTIEVNGNSYDEATTSTGSLSGTYFTLSLAQTGSFPSTGLPFNVFRHRTGTVVVDQSDWQNGWNYVKVLDDEGNVTNYIDWVYSPEAESGTDNFVFNNFTTSSVSPTGEKALSGIKYYTGFTYDFTGSISNYYKNVYNNTTIAANDGNQGFDNQSSGLNSSAVAITAPSNADSELQIESSHTVGNVRVLGTTLSSRLNIRNTLGKTGNETVTTPTALIDKVNTSNTRINENFCLEDYRVESGSYNVQSDVSNALDTFPSASSLGTAELAVYNGAVRYPTETLNSGDVNGSGTVYMISGQPNYSTATQDRWFFRGLQNGSGAAATFNIEITGDDTNFVPFGGTLSGNNVKIWVKVPGKTGWRDISTSAPASTAGIATNDNVGCRSGAQPSDLTSPGTATFGINLLTEGMSPSEYFIIRIEASSGWAGYISQIELTGGVV